MARVREPIQEDLYYTVIARLPNGVSGQLRHVLGREIPKAKATLRREAPEGERLQYQLVLEGSAEKNVQVSPPTPTKTFYRDSRGDDRGYGRKLPSVEATNLVKQKLDYQIALRNVEYFNREAAQALIKGDDKLAAKYRKQSGKWIAIAAGIEKSIPTYERAVKKNGG